MTPEPLKIGRVYLDGDGRRALIMGHIKTRPAYPADAVYSLSGAWYRKSDGAHYTYCPNRGHVIDLRTRRHLAGDPLEEVALRCGCCKEPWDLENDRCPTRNLACADPRVEVAP